MVSCSSSLGVSNGAYSDISLNRDSKEYTIKRLKEINTDEIINPESIITYINNLCMDIKNKYSLHNF